jgi:hypothetical protein
LPYPKKCRVLLPLSLSLDSDRRAPRPTCPPPPLLTCAPATHLPPVAPRLRRPGLHPRAPPACPPRLGLCSPTAPWPPPTHSPHLNLCPPALAAAPQSMPVLRPSLRPPLAHPLASSTPSVTRLRCPASTSAAAPWPPLPHPRLQCSGRRQSSDLRFGHRSPVLRHPRHQAHLDSDASASDPPPPCREFDAPAGACPHPLPNTVSCSSSAPECRPAGELYFSLLIATCLLWGR